MGTAPVAINPDLERWESVHTFIRLDRLGSLAGLTFVIVANGLFIQNPGVWILVPFLAALVGVLSLAESVLNRDAGLQAIVLVAAGNWMVAFAVAGVLPFLWPVMVLTVLMPLVLATPFVSQRQLVFLLAVSAIAGGLVTIIGLLGDDGGAIPDIEDVAELAIVTTALVIQMVPIALIVWQNNRLQRRALDQSRALNKSLAESQAEVGASRLRVIESADRMRIQIERDLHDGTQQRLLALRLQLQVLQDSAKAGSQLHQGIEAAQRELVEAINELRELSHGIYPPVLRMHGLGEAIRAVLRRTKLDTHFEDPDRDRFAESVERAVYFAATEALANVVKHAPSAHVEIALTQTGVNQETGKAQHSDTPILMLRVQDDGPGFASVDYLDSHGIFNMTDRIEAVGGQVRIASRPGEGTTVTVTVPLVATAN